LKSHVLLAPRPNIKDKLGSINCVKASFAREQRRDSLFNIYHFTTLTRRLAAAFFWPEQTAYTFTFFDALAERMTTQLSFHTSSP
jgi:hypothetical protein